MTARSPLPGPAGGPVPGRAVPVGSPDAGDPNGPGDGTAAAAPDDLLRRTARGDADAFAAIYDTFAPRVLGLAQRVVRDHGLAQDVCQEVFLEIWRRAARFDRRKGSAVSWILTIAHARSVDRVRAVRAANDRDLRVGQSSIERDVDTVSEQVEGDFERRAVRRCLDTLTELQRESIQLAFYGGYSYPEVAALLEAPLPTVKTRLRDGLIRLRDCLGVTA